MYQTAYLPLQTIGRINVPYVGGFCKWWYIPIQDISSFPAVDPVTQQLISEPVLQAGKTWYGPVNVPTNQVGWEEDLQRVKAGLFYKEKVVGFIPGMNARSHINLQNIAYHQMAIIGMVRAGGFFIILGNDLTGLELDVNTSSGIGTLDTPGSKLAFTGESINRALILPSFAGQSTPSPSSSGNSSGGSGGTGSGVEPEIIFFNNQSVINVPYTTLRRTNFGNFPTIQVWINDGTSIYMVPGPDIQVDILPPNQTNFIIRIAGPISGFIILSK